MNMKDYQAGRADGLKMALKIVEDDGIDGLREEIRKRGIAKVNPPIMMKDLMTLEEPMKRLCTETFSVLVIDTLHLRLGFGEKRVKAFMDHFWLKAECILDGMASWQEYVDAQKEELGWDIGLPEMEEEGLIQKTKAEEKRERRLLKRIKVGI